MVGRVGGRVGGSSVVHVMAEQREKLMVTTITQDYIELPASITISCAADYMPSAMLASVYSLLTRCMEEGSCSVAPGS